MKCKLDFLDDESCKLICFSSSSNSIPDSADDIGSVAGDFIYSRSLALDFSHVEAIKSEEIAWLLACHRNCSENGGNVTVHSVPSLTKKTLNMMKIDTLVRIVNTSNDL